MRVEPTAGQATPYYMVSVVTERVQRWPDYLDQGLAGDLTEAEAVGRYDGWHYIDIPSRVKIYAGGAETKKSSWASGTAKRLDCPCSLTECLYGVQIC